MSNDSGQDEASGLTFTISLQNRNNDGYQPLGNESESSDDLPTGRSASGEYDFENQLSVVGDEFRKDMFEAPEDGSNKTVDLKVKVTAELETESGATHTDSKTAPFTVDVTNQQVQFGGESGSNGSSANGGVGGVAGTGGN